MGAATTPPPTAGPPCCPGAEPPLGVCGARQSQDSATPRQRKASADSSAWHQPSMERTGPWHLTARPARWRCSSRQYPAGCASHSASLSVRTLCVLSPALSWAPEGARRKTPPACRILRLLSPKRSPSHPYPGGVSLRGDGRALLHRSPLTSKIRWLPPSVSPTLDIEPISLLVPSPNQRTLGALQGPLRKVVTVLAVRTTFTLQRTRLRSRPQPAVFAPGTTSCCRPRADHFASVILRRVTGS